MINLKVPRTKHRGKYFVKIYVEKITVSTKEYWTALLLRSEKSMRFSECIKFIKEYKAEEVSYLVELILDKN